MDGGKKHHYLASSIVVTKYGSWALYLTVVIDLWNRYYIVPYRTVMCRMMSETKTFGQFPNLAFEAGAHPRRKVAYEHDIY